MNNYICKYGLMHDKPVKDDLEPSSNNGWIYTAYFAALGNLLPASEASYMKLRTRCKPYGGHFILNRLPEKYNPPISRDEIIGMYYLEELTYFKLLTSNFYLTKYIHKHFSYLESIKTLWSIRKKHRNYVWKNELLAGYKLAFKLMPHDVYYFKKSMMGKASLISYLFFQLYCLSTVLQNNISAKNVLWLQLHHLQSKFWIKFINQPKNFKKYFGENHPLSS